ncbi:MAG: cyclophilin-like fold protein [Candidatus Helarchaeota archaeon]
MRKRKNINGELELSRKIKVNLKNANIELTGELYDTQAAKEVWNNLPIKSSINTWGEEIYFEIPVTVQLEPEATANVEIGDIGYWDVGKSMCIFFGKTPASKGDKPVAASPVNIFGKIIGNVTVLKAAKDGDEVLVQKA